MSKYDPGSYYREKRERARQLREALERAREAGDTLLVIRIKRQLELAEYTGD